MQLVLHEPTDREPAEPDGHQHKPRAGIFSGCQNADGECEERQHNPAHHHAAGHAVHALGVQLGALTAVAQVANEDHGPYEDHEHSRHSGHQRERPNNGVARIKQHDA